MKGWYGYLTTLAILIGGGYFALYFSSEAAEGSAYLIQNVLIVMLVAGFAGGFIAPYHLGSNVKKSVATIVVVLGSLIALSYFGVNQTLVLGTGDPVGDLVIGILLVVIMVILGVILVGGVIAIGIGGWIGSLIGKNVFSMDSFSDLPEKYHIIT
ncbi:MAG: hypothetical protein ACXAE3_05835 [Candidatus Kariarchaeaceae archaeon]|jgi:hypothetical protein